MIDKYLDEYQKHRSVLINLLRDGTDLDAIEYHAEQIFYWLSVYQMRKYFSR